LPHSANQRRPALAGGWAGCHNRLTANGPSMGDPGRYGRTGGTHHPLKSLGLDSSSLVSVGKIKESRGITQLLLMADL
jgi:hypothetical protein